MSAECSNPFADALPEWVPLRDLPGLLEERFQLPPEECADRLRRMLQDGMIRHRVGGLEHGSLRCSPYSPRDSYEPPGFTWSGDRIYVADGRWDKVAVEWATATVAGRRVFGGVRERHPIEPNWRDVEKLASIWQSEKENTAAVKGGAIGHAPATATIGTQPMIPMLPMRPGQPARRSHEYAA